MSKKIYSTHEKIMLFDLENYKRKLRENPTKYDWRNKLISLVAELKESGKEEVRLDNVELYVADIWILDHLGCYLEFQHFGGCCQWCYFIFLNKESHERYLEEKKQNLIDSLSLFTKMGVI